MTGEQVAGQASYSWTYDLHDMLSEEDPAGNTTAYSYDGAGRQLTRTDAANKTSSFTYNAFGEMTSNTDPLGQVTRYEYDSLGRTTGTIQPHPAGPLHEREIQTQQDPTTASGWTLVSGQGGFQDSYYTASGGIQAPAEWSFADLTAGTQYQALITWKTDAAFSGTVAYNIYDQNGNPLNASPIEVDQGDLQPDVTLDGWSWQSLGVFTVPAGTTSLTVKLDASDASGTVIADAVRLIEAMRFNVGPGGEMKIPVCVDYSQPFTGSDFAAWEAEYLANVMPETITMPEGRGNPLLTGELIEDFRDEWEWCIAENDPRAAEARVGR